MLSLILLQYFWYLHIHYAHTVLATLFSRGLLTTPWQDLLRLVGFCKTHLAARSRNTYRHRNSTCNKGALLHLQYLNSSVVRAEFFISEQRPALPCLAHVPMQIEWNWESCDKPIKLLMPEKVQSLTESLKEAGSGVHCPLLECKFKEWHLDKF